MNLQDMQRIRRRFVRFEVEFYVVHGFLPYQQEQKPAPLLPAKAPQFPEFTTDQKLPTLEPATTTCSGRIQATSSSRGGQKAPKNLL